MERPGEKRSGPSLSWVDLNVHASTTQHMGGGSVSLIRPGDDNARRPAIMCGVFPSEGPQFEVVRRSLT